MIELENQVRVWCHSRINLVVNAKVVGKLAQSSWWETQAKLESGVKSGTEWGRAWRIRSRTGKVHRTSHIAHGTGTGTEQVWIIRRLVVVYGPGRDFVFSLVASKMWAICLAEEIRSINRELFGLRDVYLYWTVSVTCFLLLDICFCWTYASPWCTLPLDANFSWTHTFYLLRTFVSNK